MDFNLITEIDLNKYQSYSSSCIDDYGSGDGDGANGSYSDGTGTCSEN